MYFCCIKDKSQAQQLSTTVLAAGATFDSVESSFASALNKVLQLTHWTTITTFHTTQREVTPKVTIVTDLDARQTSL